MMQISRRTIILGLAASGFGMTRAAAADEQVTGGFAFGSSWRVTTDADADLAGTRSMIETIVADVDADMSPYRAGSQLSRFNQSIAVDWQTMPRALCHVTAEAISIAHRTDGAFDPTVGPIVSRFGFGPIEGVAGHFSGLAVEEGALRKVAPHLTLDLCGIAKGYALDRIAGALLGAGVKNALIEVGGEVKALGHHPSGRDWQVAVTDPNGSEFRVHKIIQPGPYAVATSGHAANGINGRLSTSHIINPDLGAPASTALASVTVLAETGMEADALATAFCAAGFDKGVALARRLNVPALFVTDTDEVMTGTFSQHVLA